MDINTYMLDYIKRDIPEQVLRAAFGERINNWRQAPVSLDHQIITKLIRPRIYTDLNLVGGKITVIDISRLAPDYKDDSNTVYTIPASLTEGRTILSVMGVTYAPYASQNNLSVGPNIVSPCSVNDLTSAAGRLLDSHTSLAPMSNAEAELIGHNTVHIKDTFRISPYYHLRVLLTNHDNLGNVHPRSYPKIAKLALLGAKSYCYTKLMPELDMGYMVGGQEMGFIKDYVSGLADANELYNEYLETVVGRVMYQNDRLRMSRFIKRHIHPGL